MKLIDANVILRYLLADHIEHHNKANEVIEQGSFTTTEVLAEVVYVLNGIYKESRSNICKVLTILLEDVHIEHKTMVITSLDIYCYTNLDYIDCVLVARKKVLGDDVFTFDRKLNIELSKC